MIALTGTAGYDTGQECLVGMRDHLAPCHSLSGRLLDSVSEGLGRRARGGDPVSIAYLGLGAQEPDRQRWQLE